MRCLEISIRVIARETMPKEEILIVLLKSCAGGCQEMRGEGGARAAFPVEMRRFGVSGAFGMALAQRRS